MTAPHPGRASEGFDPVHSVPPLPATGFGPGGDLDKVLLGILSGNEEMILDRLNERVLRLAFLKNGQNQVRTAKALGVSRNVLRTYLKRYGMIT
jgi:sigma-54-specific transcriptional regulator